MVHSSKIQQRAVVVAPSLAVASTRVSVGEHLLLMMMAGHTQSTAVTCPRLETSASRQQYLMQAQAHSMLRAQ